MCEFRVIRGLCGRTARNLHNLLEFMTLWDKFEKLKILFVNFKRKECVRLSRKF